MKYSRLHSYRSYGDPPRSDSGGLEFGSVATVNSSIYIYTYIHNYIYILVSQVKPRDTNVPSGIISISQIKINIVITQETYCKYTHKLSDRP